MKIEVLCSAMHQKDMKLQREMNIDSDAVIINQCDREEYEETNIRGCKVRMYSHNERGIGRSRNCALLHASGDILLFADEDIRYEDGYKDMVLREFEAQRSADMIVFNIRAFGSQRFEHTITKRHRIRFHNCLRYGAVRFAVRREALLRANIAFSLLFGGGALYSAGEDSIFISDCIKKGMRVYASPNVLCSVDMSESSWFKGYDEKYFSDKGALLYAIGGIKAYPYITLITLKNFRQYKGSITLSAALRAAYRGIREFRNQK
ncbi:MAG: glycosyltransferase [Clostridia bacterium]|nr:glycosyltransferase [Clostridia bacterium]